MKIVPHDCTGLVSSHFRKGRHGRISTDVAGFRVGKAAGLLLIAVLLYASAATLSDVRAQNSPTQNASQPIQASFGTTTEVGASSEIGARADLGVSASVSRDQELSNSQDHGARLLGRVIQQIALGQAFDAKVRQRVWVGGREVIGVGTYEQAGDGSGRFNLQVAMHDGDGKHTLQQISDGRLAWTREQIGEEILLQRVDVGRLDQWVHGSSISNDRALVHSNSIIGHLPPSVRVGGFAEMLETTIADHDLRVVSGSLENRDVWIVRGTLKASVRSRMLATFPDNEWPELCPNEMVVAIAKSDELESGFGKGLPLRFEFWVNPNGEDAAVGQTNEADPTDEDLIGKNRLVSKLDDFEISAQTSVSDPQSDLSDDVLAASKPSSRMVSLIELYSVRPISSPPIGRFRFENLDMEVNFTNETDRYLTRYGIQITERQSRLLRR